MTVQCLLPIIPATVAEITSRISATTLLASVVPGSAPAVGLLHAFFGHHAACQRGAMFSTSRPPSPSRRPATASSILNTAPRWQAAWWRSSRFRGDIWSRTPLHAGKQRGGEEEAIPHPKVAVDSTLRVSECLGLLPGSAEKPKWPFLSCSCVWGATCQGRVVSASVAAECVGYFDEATVIFRTMLSGDRTTVNQEPACGPATIRAESPGDWGWRLQ